MSLIPSSFALACIVLAATAFPAFGGDAATPGKQPAHQDTDGPQPDSPARPEVAVFAGGCFWCMQPPYDALKAKGVLDTTVGYTGGTAVDPTYEQVSSGTTGHRESIEITFDPRRITYPQLLDIFWHNVDPYDGAGQFCDKGEQYTSVIYYRNPEQKRQAEESRDQLIRSGALKKDVKTAILPATRFYPAEDYHQEYYRKNPIRYKFYRYNCGRDRRLHEVWGDRAGGGH